MTVTTIEHPGLRHGLELFNQQRFYEAHEALEDAWRASSGEARRFLQGLTQAAVAMHHHSTGNRRGAASVLARALRNLEGYPALYAGVDLGALRQALLPWVEALNAGGVAPAAPRIGLAGPSRQDR